ncbi:MAG: pilin [bacterium]|nr:pilin [bacterium]
MRFRSILLIMVVGVFLFGISAPTLVSASLPGEDSLTKSAGKAGYSSTGPFSNITGIVSNFVSVALSVLGIVFLGMMLMSGVRWMTARGNSEFIEKAKENMIAATTGLVIVLASFAVANFLLGRFPAKPVGALVPSSGSQQPVPTEPVIPDSGTQAPEPPPAAPAQDPPPIPPPASEPPPASSRQNVTMEGGTAYCCDGGSGIVDCMYDIDMTSEQCRAQFNCVSGACR